MTEEVGGGKINFDLLEKMYIHLSIIINAGLRWHNNIEGKKIGLVVDKKKIFDRKISKKICQRGEKPIKPRQYWKSLFKLPLFVSWFPQRLQNQWSAKKKSR